MLSLFERYNQTKVKDCLKLYKTSFRDIYVNLDF